ncbi:hypothetical protein HRG_001437 [Hirsutella rhossiliensis]|uniref:Uncharacterized protein n=1 Tax=Hirsutella rhossiliensis TaxID=111463 RepID=A0A9P8SPC7_9HYPO|nr:uncharacterized protein HRG_01437 [Hirsutella rhossiliensis]KAH0968795.1 hypothetical protein HRG_01437 [Hirsutella rhossiliensis]
MAPQKKNPVVRKGASVANAGISSKRLTQKAVKKNEEQLQEQLRNLEKKYEDADDKEKQHIESQIQITRKLVDDAKSAAMELDGDNAMTLDGDAESPVDIDEQRAETETQGAGTEVQGQPSSITQEKGLFVDENSANSGATIDHSSRTQSEQQQPSGWNSGLQPDMPLVSREEPQDDGDDDNIGLVRAFDDMSLSQALGTLEFAFKGGWGVYYGVYRHGYESAPRYSIHYIGKGFSSEILRNPSSNFESKSLIVDRSAEKGTIYKIVGVAWKDVPGFGRMESLAEDQWASSSRNMFIKVRWKNNNGPESWERRGAAKDYLYPKAPQKIPGKDNLTYGDHIILNQSTKRHKADRLIIETASQSDR